MILLDARPSELSLEAGILIKDRWVALLLFGEGSLLLGVGEGSLWLGVGEGCLWLLSQTRGVLIFEVVPKFGEGVPQTRGVPGFGEGVPQTRGVPKLVVCQ